MNKEMMKKFYKHMNNVMTSAVYDFNKENGTNYDWRENEFDADTIVVIDNNTDDAICQVSVSMLDDEDGEDNDEDCEDDEC